MKQYIGSKIVKAWPAIRFWRGPEFAPEYAKVGDILPAGCAKVEDGYRIQYEDGYISWSPKDVFEEAYRETTGMSFGLAIEAMKKGLRVARNAGMARACMCSWLMRQTSLRMQTSLPLISWKLKWVTCWL